MKIILLITLCLSSLSWGETMQKMTNPEKIEHIFQNLNKDSMHLVEEFYAKDAEFVDPIESMKGADKIKAYYTNMYQNVKSIDFKFSHFIESGDSVAAIWKMTLVTEKLNGGEPIVVDGNSIIRFQDGKAVYHRDYFDMGAFIYENVPVLGFIVKKIKERFKVEE